MFVYAIGILFSNAVLAIPNGRTEVTYPTLETLRSGMKIVKFNSFGTDIELKLEPAGDVIADDFTIMDGKGKIQKSNVKNLKRGLFRDNEKGAALYINEEGPLEIKGMLTSELRIDPDKSQDMVKGEIRAHRITEAVIEEQLFHDEVINLNSKKSFYDDVRSFDEDQCVEIEYLPVIDNTITNQFAKLKELETHITTMFVYVQSIMNTLKLKIKVRLIGMIIFTNETEPSFVEDSLFPEKNILHFDNFMRNFSKYYCLHKEDGLVKLADIIMFITKRVFGSRESDGTIFTGILGGGYLGKVCNSCYKVGMAVDLGIKMNTAGRVAHETAHLLGSPHDGEGGKDSLSGAPGATKCPGTDGFLMGNNFGIKERKFSTCTRENIKFFLIKPQAECIIADCEKTL